MSFADNGRSEAEYHQRTYGGTLYESPSGWGVKDTFVPGSKTKGSIIPILYYGEGYGGPSRQMFESSSLAPKPVEPYWDRVGADLARLPTTLTTNLLVNPVKAVAGGAGDIVKEGLGDVGSGVGKGVSELAKALIVPAAVVVGSVILVLVVSGKTGTTASAERVATRYVSR